ncbi:dihydrofolate reductase family protein [Nocardioides dilutus]
MPLVTAHFTISLDGYMAGPDQTLDEPLGVGGEDLHRWMFDEASHPADVTVKERILAPRGAYIMGRNMFGPVRGPWEDAVGGETWRGWWGDDPPYHAPVFVLTHHPHAPIEMEGGTTFHFVAGFDEALSRAVDAAGGETVTIAGGPVPSARAWRPGWSTSSWCRTALVRSAAGSPPSATWPDWTPRWSRSCRRRSRPTSSTGSASPEPHRRRHHRPDRQPS